jgi:cytochrome c oxidase subunit 2
MEIHRYEKFWFGASLLLIVGFIVTIAYGAVGAGVQMVSDDGGTVDDPGNYSEGERFAFDQLGVTESNDSEIDYEVNMRAQQFAFLPAEITVPAGSTVRFYITSDDVVHGFELPGTNVNTMVIPGQITQITVEFDKTGEYGYVCTEYCGAQHHIMEGVLKVVPEDEWEGDA